MQLRRFDGVDAFLAAAGEFLAAREAEHNLILGICSNLRERPESYTAAPYLATVRAGDRIVAAALQTPPFQLILSEVDDPAAILLLAQDLLVRDLPGALGPVQHIRALVDARAALGGPKAHLRFSERMFQLTEVRPPRPIAGNARLAVPDDRELVGAWIAAFLHEALGQDDPAEARDVVAGWLSGRGRTIHLWEDGGVPVSLVGAGSPTPNGIRIGPVYTPPEERNRGYASALVAAVSQAELDAGRRFCFLFTDLANPTANHIYQSIGYEPVRDVDAYRFDRP